MAESKVNAATAADAPPPATQRALGHQATGAPTADKPPRMSEGVAQDVEQARARIRATDGLKEARVGDPAGGEWVVTERGKPRYEAPVVGRPATGNIVTTDATDLGK